MTKWVRVFRHWEAKLFWVNSYRLEIVKKAFEKSAVYCPCLFSG